MASTINRLIFLKDLTFIHIKTTLNTMKRWSVSARVLKQKSMHQIIRTPTKRPSDTNIDCDNRILSIATNILYTPMYAVTTCGHIITQSHLAALVPTPPSFFLYCLRYDDK